MATRSAIALRRLLITFHRSQQQTISCCQVATPGAIHTGWPQELAGPSANGGAVAPASAAAPFSQTAPAQAPRDITFQETTPRPRHLSPARGPGRMPHGDLPPDLKRLSPEELEEEEAEKKKYLPRATMSDVLSAKHVGKDGALTCGPDDLVIDAVRKMVKHGVGALVVVSPAGERVSGIITERDYLRKIIVQGRSSRTTHVNEVMTTETSLTTVPPEANVCDVMQLMTDKKIRHMPVVSTKDGKLLGVVSLRDMVDTVVSEKRVERKELLDYINTSY